MSAILGVPEHAAGEWRALSEALDDSTRLKPCQGKDSHLWTGLPTAQKVAARRCLDCPVMVFCAAYAKAAREPEGTWGGYTASERKSA